MLEHIDSKNIINNLLLRKINQLVNRISLLLKFKLVLASYLFDQSAQEDFKLN